MVVTYVVTICLFPVMIGHFWLTSMSHCWGRTGKVQDIHTLNIRPKKVLKKYTQTWTSHISCWCHPRLISVSENTLGCNIGVVSEVKRFYWVTPNRLSKSQRKKQSPTPSALCQCLPKMWAADYPRAVDGLYFEKWNPCNFQSHFHIFCFLWKIFLYVSVLHSWTQFNTRFSPTLSISLIQTWVFWRDLCGPQNIFRSKCGPLNSSIWLLAERLLCSVCTKLLGCFLLSKEQRVLFDPSQSEREVIDDRTD